MGNGGTEFTRVPGKRPVVGHLLRLRRDPLGFLESLPAYGDLARVRLGPWRAFVACHPDVAHEVLTDFRRFDRTGPVYDKVRQAMGAGLATAGYHDHRRQRLVMQPAFRHEHLSGYVEVMRKQVTAATADWQDGQELDLTEAMFELTTGVALTALFSSRLGGQETRELRSALDVFLGGLTSRAALPGIGRLPTPGNRRYARALDHWQTQVRRLIEGYSELGAGQDDLMSRLLAARDEEGHALSYQELSDQVAVLLLAGGETTSSAVVWAVHLLSGRPDVLAAVRAEVDAVLGGRAAGAADLPQLELTGRVVKETLRLYPPGWLTLRTATHDTTLGGHRLEAGSMVLISPYLLHRREDFYHDAARFEPDRWLASPPATRGSYLPFGAGATKCIGEEFGEAEATVILASLLGRWELTPIGGPVTCSARLVLSPASFRVWLSARSTTS
ncbi:cytochrome P450 [Streptomyces sp. NPDC087270]|uniref:cytochrome P450 n=1 Tax=Streptomyces sp. NPDC087270 TaxID=3365774 RepID=UPI00381CB837